MKTFEEYVADIIDIVASVFFKELHEIVFDFITYWTTAIYGAAIQSRFSTTGTISKGVPFVRYKSDHVPQFRVVYYHSHILKNKKVCNNYFLFTLFKYIKTEASLIVQWQIIHLPMQETRVQPLIQEDPTYCGTTKQLLSLCSRAQEPEPICHSYWSPHVLEPVLCNKRNHVNEKPAIKEWPLLTATVGRPAQ